jgi:hypothetical protein
MPIRRSMRHGSQGRLNRVFTNKRERIPDADEFETPVLNLDFA